MNEELSQENSGISEENRAKMLANLKPWKPGQSGNPSGRPKGTMKDFVRKMFMEMSDEDKAKWLLDNKITGIDMWKMGEGQPKQETELDATITGPALIRIDE